MGFALAPVTSAGGFSGWELDTPAETGSAGVRSRGSRFFERREREVREGEGEGAGLTSSTPWGKGLSSQSFSGKRCRMWPRPSLAPEERGERGEGGERGKVKGG